MFLVGIIDSSNNLESQPVVPAAMPTYVGKGTVAEGTGSISPGLPTGLSDGMFMILFAQTDTEVVSAPSGWTEFSMSPVQYATTTRTSLFYRRYVSGDTAPTITDPGDHCIAQIYAFDGCNSSGEPIDTYGTSTWAGTVNFDVNCGTTTSANILIAIFVSGGADSTTSRYLGYGVNATLANLNQRASEGTDLGAGGSIDLWTGEKDTAGDCGHLTDTLGIASAGAAIVLGLKG